MNNLVLLSDFHSGSKFSLHPPEIELDEGFISKASKLQLKLWKCWQSDIEWIEQETGGKFNLLFNGDCVEGNRFHRVDTVSNNIVDQCTIFQSILEPLREKAERFFMIRGTEAHVGKSGGTEESLARALKAEPDSAGRHARYDIDIRFDNGALVNIHHHGRIAKETNAPNLLMGEWLDCLSARFRRGQDNLPHMIITGHGHDFKAVDIGTPLTQTVSMMLPPYKLIDGHGKKVLSARNSVATPGVVILYIEDGVLKYKKRLHPINQTEEVVL